MRYSNDKSQINKRIAFLDYLRIFAFTSVLIGHKFYAYVVALSNDPTVHISVREIASASLPLLYGGGAGVVVFFLVSGYIITYVLQTEQTGEFLIKRVFRIYPLYIVAVLVQLVPQAASGNWPDIWTLLPQLLLVGDIFGTPYTLSGVEWTLRLEIVFYILMAILASLNLTTTYKKLLPYIILGVTFLCSFIAPIPSANIWSKGYLTIYGPFLLLGVAFFLFETKQIRLTFFSIFVGIVFYQYYSLIATYQKNSLNAHFAILAFFIFLIAWAFRRHITAKPWILVLSSMTYAVYLFHNWFFDYAKKTLAHFNISVINPDIQALVVLLLVCFVAVKYVERPGIRIGHRLLGKIKAHQNSEKQSG